MSKSMKSDSKSFKAEEPFLIDECVPKHSKRRAEVLIVVNLEVKHFSKTRRLPST